MNQDQVSGMFREIATTLVALLVSFNIFPETHVDVIVASTVAIAVAIWGVVAKPEGGAALASLVRKGMAAIPPILLLCNTITSEQAASLNALIFAGVAAWSMRSNKA